jgi:hypothetical protein
MLAMPGIVSARDRHSSEGGAVRDVATLFIGSTSTVATF